MTSRSEGQLAKDRGAEAPTAGTPLRDPAAPEIRRTDSREPDGRAGLALESVKAEPVVVLDVAQSPEVLVRLNQRDDLREVLLAQVSGRHFVVGGAQYRHRATSALPRPCGGSAAG